MPGPVRDRRACRARTRTALWWHGVTGAVDSFTHGLIAAVLVYVLGLPGLIPFAVAGAVVLDADTFFARAFDRRPSLYLFTHGGIAHSLAGAAVMALPAYAVAALVAPAVPFFPAVAAPLAFAAVLGGAYLHIGLDTLACPGLPLLAPRSDRKYTVGLLPGPSVLLFGGQHRRPGRNGAGRDLLAGHDPSLRRDHRRVPRRPARGVRPRPGETRTAPAGPSRRTSPLRWLVIGETPDAWTVGEYRLGRGMTEPAVYPKYRDTTADAVAPYLDRPRGQAGPVPLVHHDGRAGGGPTSSSRTRCGRPAAILYPPYFAETRIPMQERAGSGAGR